MQFPLALSFLLCLNKGMDEKVNFSSEDIGKKEKPDYFVRVEKTSHSFDYYIKDFFRNLWQNLKNGTKHLFAFLFDGKHKFITLSVTLLLIIGIIVTVLLLNNKPTVEYTVDATEAELEQTRLEARDLFNASDEGYYQGIQLYKDKISHAKNGEVAVAYTIALAKYCANHGDAPSALEFLGDVNEEGVAEIQLIDYYAILAYTYKISDDKESADAYYEKMYELIDKYEAETGGGE